MTGDPKADADIMAFIKARQNILRKGKDISSVDNVKYIVTVYIFTKVYCIFLKVYKLY